MTQVAIGDDTIGVGAIEHIDDTTIKVTTPVRLGIQRTAGAEVVSVTTGAGISTSDVYFTYRPVLQTANVKTGTASEGLVTLNSGDDTLAVASMRKPITRSATAPFTVTGTWSAGTAEDSGSPYSYVTDVYLNPNSDPAYGYESDERAVDGSWTTTFDSSANYLDRTGVLEMTSNGDCQARPNGAPVSEPRNTKDGYETYCSVFGPEIYSEPFYGVAGQALSFSWAAKRVSDDFEVYAYLINVPSLDDTTTGIADDSVSVVAHGIGKNAAWTISSAQIDDTGYYMFRFVNGSYDGTGGLALGSNMYIDPSVIVGLANTITFPSPGSRTASFTALVSATSGAAVTVVSDDTSVCTVGAVSVSGAVINRVVADDTVGTCNLTASQGAVGTYAPAQPVSISFQFIENTSPPAPDPAVLPSAPVDVRAAAGNTAAVVSWSAPASSGTFPVSTYQAVSQPGGRSCLVSAPTTACTVTGLANGTTYTFTVRALTGAGWGPYSSPSNPVTPSGDPAPAPDPVPVPPLPPGDSSLTVDGEPRPVTVEPNQASNGVDITADDFSMNLQGLDGEGKPLELGPGGVLILNADRQLQTSGTGFLGSSEVDLYLDPPTLVTAGSGRATQADMGTYIGTVITNRQGSFSGTAQLPEGISVGDHVLQAVGLTETGVTRAVSLGVRVEDPVTVPGPVRDIELVRVSADGTAVLRWRVPSFDGGSPVIAYRVGWREVGARAYVRVRPNATKTRVRITGLEPGKAYWVRIRAGNSVGFGPGVRYDERIRIPLG